MPESVREAFAQLALKTGRSAEEVADGFIRIAVENMANAIKRISVARGYDVRRYALACFGGAGGQHACLVADALGITRIFIHPFSGVLSAYGMRFAAIRAFRHRAIGLRLNIALAEHLAVTAQEMVRDATAEVEAQGGANADTKISVHIRYAGSDTTLPVPLATEDEMSRAFVVEHARQFGFGTDNKQLIAESIEVEAFSREPEAVVQPPGPAGAAAFKQCASLPLLLARRMARLRCTESRRYRGRRGQSRPGNYCRATPDDHRRAGLACESHARARSHTFAERRSISREKDP